jgi:hypothetical protein
MESRNVPRLTPPCSTVLPGSPAEFGKLIADEIEKWGNVIRALNIKIVDKLNKEINACLADPRMKARLADLGQSAYSWAHQSPPTR